MVGNPSSLVTILSAPWLLSVLFTTDSSQGDGTGACFFACFVAHIIETQTLAHFPDIPVHILSIIDDFHKGAPAKYLGPLFQILSDILLDCAGIKINISKCSLGLHVVDNDKDMSQRISHLSSQKRGDLAMLSTKDYLIYDQISKQPLSQAIADIKMVSLVNSLGTWTQATS